MKLFTSAILAACASAETERFMTQAFTNCEHAHLATENTDVGGATCPKNKVIRVMASSYGRNDDNTCHGGNFYDSYPECSLDVTHHAAADCDGKRSCNYNANNKEIADPCVGTHKYTKVLYKCESVEAADELKNSVSCEHASQGNNDRKISCDAGQVIQIEDAWYGRQSATTCNGQNLSNFSHSVPEGGCQRDASDFISGKCNGKRSCSIKIRNADVGDPCVGTTKYSNVQWKCINECNILDSQPIFQEGSEVECNTRKNGNKKCVGTCPDAKRTTRKNIWSCDRSDPQWVEAKQCV
jgi:hypothetical protein